MSITLQAQQADGAWFTRNAFISENAMVRIGEMRASQMDDKAHRTMDRWHDYHDGKTLRVHNTRNDR